MGPRAAAASAAGGGAGSAALPHHVRGPREAVPAEQARRGLGAAPAHAPQAAGGAGQAAGAGGAVRARAGPRPEANPAHGDRHTGTLEAIRIGAHRAH